MDACQVFLKAGPFFRRIKTINVEKFMRPVRETTRSVQNPASHLGKTLPFWKIELAPSQLFFRPLAILNVESRSIQLDDLAVRIAKRHFPVEHPAVFSIRAADASFVFEDFSSREAGSPLGPNPLNVLRVDDSW